MCEYLHVLCVCARVYGIVCMYCYVCAHVCACVCLSVCALHRVCVPACTQIFHSALRTRAWSLPPPLSLQTQSQITEETSQQQGLPAWHPRGRGVGGGGDTWGLQPRARPPPLSAPSLWGSPFHDPFHWRQACAAEEAAQPSGSLVPACPSAAGLVASLETVV